MKKRVLILSTSPRQGGNSDALAASFAEGARSAGHTVSHCSLRDKSLHFCLGCLSCQETPGCVLQDDMAEILSQMRTADVLVFATPIYFYEMSGQMKTLLDRTNPLFSGEYAFRAVYLLAAAAEAAPQAVDGALHGLEGWLACFPKATLQGVVCGCGVTGAGEIQDSPAQSIRGQSRGTEQDRAERQCSDSSKDGFHKRSPLRLVLVGFLTIKWLRRIFLLYHRRKRNAK